MKRKYLFLIVFCFVSLVLAANGSAQAPKKVPADFLEFLKKVDSLQVELQNGNASNWKQLWSNADDVTISGGFGGTIEKGWDAVSKRLDWAATQFSNGTNSIERIVVAAEGNIGYLIQIEHIKFNVPSTGAAATRDFRITMIFRREKGKWKIVHRHADGQIAKQPA